MKSKLGAACLALFISFGLWLYVITVVSPESQNTYLDIPVVMDGESLLNDRGLMIIAGGTQTVDLKLEGYRTDLSQLNKANITLLADLSQITTAGEHKLSYDISYPGILQSGTITVLEQTPKLITVVVAELAKKEVPVNVVYTGAVPENYIAHKQSVTLDHTTVTVSGPKDIVSQIDHAQVTVDLTGKNTTISGAYNYTLCDKYGSPVENVAKITTNLNEIRVTLRIQKTKEIPLILHVIYGGGVTEQTSEIILDRETIQVAGNEAVLDSLNEIVLGTLDLSDILESTTMTYPIILPEDVTNITNVTEVNVSINFPDLQIRKFKVSNFVAEKLPDGLEAQWLTDSLTVYLRGAKEVLDKLGAEDISVVVNFTGAEVGNQVYSAVIMVNTTGVVGAIGTYEVYVSVRVYVPQADLDLSYGTDS